MMKALMRCGKKKTKEGSKKKEEEEDQEAPLKEAPAATDPFLSVRIYKGYDREKNKCIYTQEKAHVPMAVSQKRNWEKAGWSATLKTLLEGVHQKARTSPLSLLRGKESVLVRHIHSFLSNAHADKVVLTPSHEPVGRTIQADWETKIAEGHDFDLDDLLAYTVCAGGVTFPEPADRNINMMPFIFGDKLSLPEEYRCYWHMIQACEHCNGHEEEGQVGYLTIQESYVDASKTQRRSGIHVEAPGGAAITLARFQGTTDPMAGAPGVFWGGGKARGGDIVEGGIFIASTVANTTMVWNALVKDKSIVGKHGDCEHLRQFFGDGVALPADQLVWMTDRTPHEALPQTESGYRQFFRVVTSRVSQWHADHSTPNPLVAVPDHVEIVRGNKFASD